MVGVPLPSQKWLASPQGRSYAARTGARFKTTNELAVDALSALPKSWSNRYRVTVLMDSGFYSKVVCPAVRKFKFHFIAAAGCNRTLRKCRRDGL